MAAALESGKVACFMADVLSTEPPEESNPLLHAKNCMVTPHVAFASQESMKRRAKIVFDSLKSWLNGQQVNRIC